MHMYIYIHIYIYIYIYMHVYALCIYIYIYIMSVSARIGSTWSKFRELSGMLVGFIFKTTGEDLCVFC